jgi:hypothetical protein
LIKIGATRTAAAHAAAEDDQVACGNTILDNHDSGLARFCKFSASASRPAAR